MYYLIAKTDDGQTYKTLIGDDRQTLISFSCFFVFFFPFSASFFYFFIFLLSFRLLFKFIRFIGQVKIWFQNLFLEEECSIHE